MARNRLAWCDSAMSESSTSKQEGLWGLGFRAFRVGFRAFRVWGLGFRFRV